MRKRLKQKLSNYMPREQLSQVYDSFDIIGDIAIFKMPKDDPADARKVASQIMTTHKSVKTVFVQTSPVAGDFRIRQLRLVAGENKTTTAYKESGCVFKVDVEKCYFSPRLSHEHLRVAGLVASGEVVVNMFAGVGSFSILICKNAQKPKVYSIDVNPTAFSLMEENIRVNRLYNVVVPLLGDAKEVIQARLQGKADRVLMPLPELALQYLPYAVMALKKEGGWIHYYDFQHAVGKEDPVEKTKAKVTEKLAGLGVECVFDLGRVVRSTGPNWYQTVLDIHVKTLPSKF